MTPKIRRTVSTDYMLYKTCCIIVLRIVLIRFRYLNAVFTFLNNSFNYFPTNDCQLDIFLWTAVEVISSVKSQCRIARNDEDFSQFSNSNIIYFTDQP